MKRVVWFRDVDKDDVGLAGGKGANLGELTKAKIPVPPGFIVTSHSYFQFLKESGLEPKIAELLKDLNADDSATLQALATRVKELMTASEMPGEIAAEIRRAYRELGEGPVAVRSSATAEDLAEASFAGQQSTFLNVIGEENVVAAVRACWASLFEARAIFYREHSGFDHLSVGIAVPVQKMIQSQRSGVMFTLEPVEGARDKIVIEAIYGLGEAIVSGAVTPDLYIVDKASLNVLQKTIADQEKQYVRNDDSTEFGEDNNLWADVPKDDVKLQKLKDDEIVALAEIGKRVEEYYSTPQDIEWGEEGGELYILQSRPVTVSGEASSDDGAAMAGETAPILLEGSPASPGVVAGQVKIVASPSEIDKVVDGDILVADMTTPDFVPAMKRAAAIVTNKGGRTAHAAIVSRELGIPCVVGTGNATDTLINGQVISVDGSRGRVYQGRAEVRLAWAAEEKKRRSVMSTVKTRTNVYVNLAEPELADRVAKQNVDGVGLLRAEFIVAQIGEHPRLVLEEGRREEFVAKLADGLRLFASSFNPRPVIYRTTDFKTNEYRNLKGGEKYEPEEENPMIGFRGASRYVRDEDAFKMEIDAIKRVREQYKNLWVMIPFVRTPEELAEVKAILEREGLERSADFKLWMMAEVPSNVFLLDRFIDVGIDGISIGSNDLTQLVLGIDRDNAKFEAEFDERNEAVMIALEMLVSTARRRGVTCSICGQAPSDYPELTQKLVDWGITSVSVNPDVIDKTREIIARAEGVLEAESATKASPAAPIAGAGT
jgi:pyruvate,water dikinase